MTLPVLAGLALAAVATLSTSVGASPEDTGVVGRFLSIGTPVPRSYTAHRWLEATAQDGAMRATLEADTRVVGGRFSYQVTGTSGSSLLRRYVLERALEEERQTINEGRSGEAELVPANYAFQPAGGDGQGRLRIRIVPHVPARMLLVGLLRVEPTGELVAIEGRLSELPSFWTTRVDIERVYELVGGQRVPTLMRSLAQVRVVGTGTFEMRWAYSEINGKAVTPST